MIATDHQPKGTTMISFTKTVSLIKSEDAQFLAWSRNFNRAQVEGVIARTSKIDLAGRVFGRKPIDPGFYRQFVSHDPSPLVRRV